MVMDRPFTTASPVLVNYSVADYLDGTGIQNFYLAQAINSATWSQVIVQDTSIIIGGAGIKYNFNKGGVVVVTFDLMPFNETRSLYGTASLAFNAIRTSGGTENLTFQLQKVSGGVATNLGASTVVTVTASSVSYFTTMAITTETVFTKGDNLRLIITPTTGTGNLYIGTDPSNQNDGDLGPFTRSTLRVPYRTNA